MEKVNKILNINNLEGDCDDSIEWEDFVMINGNFHNSHLTFCRRY